MLTMGKGIARFNFKWSDHFSTALQGEVFGTSGTLNIIDFKGLVELRYTWGG